MHDKIGKWPKKVIQKTDPKLTKNRPKTTQNEPIFGTFLGQVLKELPAYEGQNDQKGGSKYDPKISQNIPK
jgi:hypothetical protein